ncbi:MAG: molybdopterin-containing oxidoreductase family protein, partial [Pseudomonadales bacterium]
MPTRKSYCRICGAWCAIKVDVQDNKVIAIHGDKDDPETKGFTCTKGRQIPFQMNESKRLLTSLARNENGTLETIDYQQAVRRIASKLQQIIDRHGPRSVAVYCGTHGWFNSAFIPVVRAWLDKLGSPNYYSSLTVDCPAQFTAKARAGHWAGGHHSFKSADVVLMAGRNPLVSNLSSTLGGLPGSNPGRLLKDARQRGLKLICVDPRESDLAKRADIHLQLKPGEDASLFAGLIHVILQEDLHDQAFCERWVDGLNTLRNAVQAFTPEYAALRAEVPVEKLVEAARLFARGPRGCASGGLGTEMSRHAELNHYLILALNIICGRFNRQGERVANPGVLLPPGPLFEGTLPKEQLPSIMSFGTGEQPRVRGLKSICGEMPCNGLADEILTPGDGQVRAFICVGGNPVLAFPDTDKTIKAMKDLELLVCVDPHRSATAALADYVIAPKLPLERDDLTVLGDANYEQPYAHYAPAVVDAAPELVEEWEFILDLAAEMGTDITINEER